MTTERHQCCEHCGSHPNPNRHMMPCRDCGQKWGIAEMVERSSLGTPDARALRNTVSDERAAAIVARAAAMSGADHE